MNSEQKAITLTLATILVGLAALINESYRIILLALYPIVVIIYIFSSYINKIEQHERDIREMNKKLEIHERLSRLEGRVFFK